MDTAYIKTPLGVAEIQGDANGVSVISIRDAGLPVSEAIPESLRRAADELQSYFETGRRDFTFALNPSGTDFQKKVWQLLTEIPYGKTVSYLDLARRFGDEKAIRAVASANGKNPLWIVVPCHRVIGTDGSLTGYAGGLWRKKWLLEHETPTGQTSLF